MKKYLEYKNVFVDIPPYTGESVEKEAKKSYRFALRYKLYQLYSKANNDMELAFNWIYAAHINEWPGMLLCLEHEVKASQTPVMALSKAQKLFDMLK